MKSWKEWTKKLKREVFTLYYAYQDPRTPIWTKIVITIVVAYAFSPVDLIPDFIPILGYLDDLILLPIGIAFAIKIIPIPVLEDSRKKADSMLLTKKPKNWIAGSIIVLVRLIFIGWLIYLIYTFF
nr:YkvA family protein [Polycladomyces abyssicola]